MKNIASLKLKDFPNLQNQLLEVSENFEYSSVLLSNGYQDTYGKYEILAAFGAASIIEGGAHPFEKLKKCIEDRPRWLFGHLNYDLKNRLEQLTSQHPANFELAELHFFEPQFLVLQLRGVDTAEVLMQEGMKAFQFMDFLKSGKKLRVSKITLPEFTAKQTKSEYLTAIENVKERIQQGDIYELNYCQEFYVKEVYADPKEVFKLLNKRSPMPFASFYKQKTNYLMGASPERFMCKRENKIFSQPIKGTAKRGNTETEDSEIKEALKTDLKEQTENVMIVDLVRNDLSRTAAKGTVNVEELFGVYSFPQVHQLISTISSTLSDKYHFTDAIKFAFPMGSMTGAPKISAMKIADNLEFNRRELYSGSVGYIEPTGDFDFNVVIRSLLYNTKSKYLSLTVGGAITIASDPEKEYEECLLKAKAIFELNKA